MSVNREELKRMIDHITEYEALEVFDFIGYLNMKREKGDQQLLDVVSLSNDADLIRQIGQSREDRQHGNIYGQETGLEYLRNKVKEFEHGQNV